MLKRGGRTVPSLYRVLLIIPLWILSIAWMWNWWFMPHHNSYAPLFVPLTFAMLYEFTILPSVFLFFIIKAKHPKRRIAPKGKKVAIITLCVPSKESLEIIEKQLKAISEVTYPHDSWVLDEGNNKKIKQLARKYKVKYFTRKGVKKYNQASHPFQKKTKAGNVNAWLDHVKRRKYEFFVQLDIDHIPNPNYLNKTLGHLRDPEVAWVQAPSVYKNLQHWTARGAAEQELVLQGPLQMGFYGFSGTPFIIGSHCTYRMSAIREIGGFQPTRAEDHLDTVHLAHHGYKGVFLPEIIAQGDGPETLNTYFAQQFAWAYSMFQVLIWHTPRLLKNMSWRQRLQFLFAQTWYPLWAISYLILFMSPILSLSLNRDIMTVSALDSITHFVPLFIASFLVWWSARPLMQPRNIRLSWRGMILHAARWPIILRAIIAALFKINKPYMITPKGKFSRLAPSLRMYSPFLLLGFLSSAIVVITAILKSGYVPEAQIVFALFNTSIMLCLCIVDILLRIRQLKPKKRDFKKYWVKPVSATAVLFLTWGISIALAFYYYMPSVNYKSSYASISLSTAPTAPIEQIVNYNMSTDKLTEYIKLVELNANITPKLGIYNPPTLDLSHPEHFYLEHSFVDWRDEHYFALVMAKSLQKNNTPLITIEPRGEEDGTKLLNDITKGVYDKQLQNLANILAGSKNPVYIRFAHEMELKNLYPWGNQDPELYISAYNHVTDMLRSQNPYNVRLVWSPAGNQGAQRYYPGDSRVDVIGTTILYDRYWYGSYAPSFARLSSSRSWLKSYNKPVWIVEFGAGYANQLVQKRLLSDALASYDELGYKALVYLNIKDSNITGPDYRLNSIEDISLFYQDKPPKVKSMSNQILDNSKTEPNEEKSQKISCYQFQLPMLEDAWREKLNKNSCQ